MKIIGYCLLALSNIMVADELLRIRKEARKDGMAMPAHLAILMLCAILIQTTSA